MGKLERADALPIFIYILLVLMSKGASETRAANPTDPQKLCNKLNHSLAMCPNVHNILEFFF